MNIKRLAFQPKVILDIDGQPIQLMQLVGTTWNCVDLKTNMVFTLPVEELLQAQQQGKVKTISTNPGLQQAIRSYQNSTKPLDQVAQEVQSKAQARYDFLEYLRRTHGALPIEKLLKSEIEGAWEKHSKGHATPSTSTVRRWWTRWMMSGFSILSLVDNNDLKGNRNHRIDIELENICMTALKSGYLTPARENLTLALATARALAREYNKDQRTQTTIPLPTKTTLKSILKSIGAEDVYSARHGKDAARAKFRRTTGYVVADAPLQRVEIDHTRLNLKVVDAKTGLNLSRPWLTVIIDCHTRCILGFHLSLSAPSSSTLATVLKKAIQPKTHLKHKYPDIKSEWNMYGIPFLIAVDGGLEFHSQSFKEACRQLGINIIFMPRKRPWWKPYVERAIGTLNNGVCALVPGGQTFRSIAEKGNANPNKTACMTLEHMEQNITMWIVDYYHQRPHNALDTTPQYQWDSTVDFTQIQFLEDLSVLDALSGNLANRKVFHYGIELNHVRYVSDELLTLHHQGLSKVLLRWNPEDLGSITVLLDEGGHLVVPVHPRKHYLQGTSLVQYQATRQDMINRGLDPNQHDATEDTLLRIKRQSQAWAEETTLAKKHFKKIERLEPQVEPVKTSVVQMPTKNAKNPFINVVPTTFKSLNG